MARVVWPDGGETVEVGQEAVLQWLASDDVGVLGVDLLLSRTGVSGSYEYLATSLANTGVFDRTVTGPGTGQAFLKVVAHDGDASTGEDTSDSAFTILNLSGVEGSTVTEFALDMQSAQPATGGTMLSINMPYKAHVRLTVFDLQGRSVAVLEDGILEPGHHSLLWTGTSAHGRVSPGVYFLGFETPGKLIHRKIVLIH